MAKTEYNQHLPDDVLLNIFIRLPAKQLAQMRSLSKPWNAHLSQPSFIKSHLGHSINTNDDILMVFHTPFSHDGRRPFKFKFTAHPSRTPHIELTNLFKLPKTMLSDHTSVIGSVDGLICFISGMFINIWNPSLSALLTLPPYALPSITNSLYFGFGFEPKSEDYKVVKLTCRVSFLDASPGFFVELPTVEVYSMRRGSWKSITQSIPSSITCLTDDRDTVCVDGHLHWIGDVYILEELRGQTIVAFDLDAETFNEISLPDSIGCAHTNVLGVLAGGVCVMSTSFGWNECEVWVMVEYGVAESWVKRHAFSLNHGGINPLGFTSNNEFLFIAIKENTLALYDPVTSKVKSIKRSTHTSDNKTKVVQYVDSLVWVAPASRGRSAVAASLRSLQI